MPFGGDRAMLRDRKFADSSVEGNGFEISVPRCLASPTAWAPSFRWVSSGSLSRRNSSSVCRGRRPLGCFRRAGRRWAPTRPKPRNRCLSGTELKFRIHFPPARSPQNFRFLSDCGYRESERDRWPLSGSAHQFPLDRNRVTEEVQYRAVGVNSRGQFFVASWEFRSTQVNPNAHGI